MIDQRNDAAKAHAEAAFNLPATETKPPDGLAEYSAKQEAEPERARPAWASQVATRQRSWNRWPLAKASGISMWSTGSSISPDVPGAPTLMYLRFG